CGTVVILGDVNKNGRIDSGDAKLMIDHYMGNRKLTGDALIAVDVNRNGRVDSGDAVKNTIKYSSPSDYTTSLNKNKKAQ
ncbi:MAG: dockerin type I repeat-containing protein, partial [Clostridia bacterium]|nr:dockerin type I repeat-containing protein [Clostridia bacterium]